MTQLPDDPILKRPAVPGTRMTGWGADRNPADRPAVPKEKPSNVHTVRGHVGARQKPEVKIHLSVEHPDLTPVFGTTCPPRGLSGSLRDYAYQFGEGRLARWMTLLLADRIDVLESRIEDLGRGRMPHPIRERGYDVDGKRVLMIAGATIGAVALAVLASHAARDR